MSETINKTAFENPGLDGLEAHVESTADLARLADELYPTKIGDTDKWHAEQHYDSRDPLPHGHLDLENRKNIVIGDRHFSPAHKVAQLNTPEGRTFTASTEKSQKMAMVNKERLQGKYNDIWRIETPSLRVTASAGLTEESKRSPIESQSVLEVKGTRHGKRIEKRLESDNPLVARMIADIALKEIRQTSTDRINAKRLEHYDRWQKEVKQANKQRSITDKFRGKNKVSSEDLMRAEADAENAAFDKEKDERRQELESFAKTLDSIRDQPEAKSDS